jgi:hypothetical protein
MLKTVSRFTLAALVALFGGIAQAEILLPTPQLIGTAQIGQPLVITRNGSEFVAVYDNSTNPTALGTYSATGAAGGATKIVADDTVPTAGGILNEFSFSVSNANTVAVAARPRVRFWAADGAGGGPGSLIAGFSFNPITFNANTLNVFTTGQALAANNILLPNAPMWWGMLFDNVGVTATTNAQLDLLGQVVIDPPSIGSSNPQLMWEATATGSNFVSNPAGATITLAGVPSNLLYEYQVVPEPTAVTLALVGMVALVARRRS